MEVLDVLGALKDALDFRFDIMGRVWDERAVAARAAALGIAERVRVHGFVSEGELDRRLAEADLVFNLRWPTMGEASGSQLRIWNAGAPSVVTDAGWYSELDDTTVFKTRIETEAEDLTTLLRRLAADRSLGAARGAAGRALLETRHSPRAYARAIAEIARTSPAALHDATLARAAAPVSRAVAPGSVAADVYTRAFAAGLKG
jgi:glycosyltransferase involved in cell wall biosynthesis